MKCPQELIDAHWNYVSSALMTHGASDESLLIAEFHYRTAAEHFWKHAKMDNSERTDRRAYDFKDEEVIKDRD